MKIKVLSFYLSLMLMMILFNDQLTAADEYTISGYVRDASTGEMLIGASIFDDETKIGCRSNAYGFYSLTLPEGKHLIKYRYISYEELGQEINLNKNIKMNGDLIPKVITTEAVVVTAVKLDDNVKNTEMGVARISPSKVKSVPVIFGELDVLKTIQLLPGVSMGREGNSGYYVRGGGPDQNLILLDEATVYNASHLMGFFSVFNSDAIKDVTLYKGAAPAQYGGRLSSILDIKMNEGNSKEYKVQGGVGIIASRLTVEGPIVEDQGSFIISGRRTYADLFLLLSTDDNLSNSSLYFYDLNMKANYKISEDDRVFVSGYLGRDVTSLNDQFGIDWGNTTATIRWNHLFNEKLFSNTTLIYSKYDYQVDFENGEDLIDIKSSIEDFSLKEDFQYFIKSGSTLNFGLTASYHSFLPGEISSSADSSTIDNTITEKYAVEHALYVAHEFDISDNLKLNYGIRYSGFSLVGPGKIYTYDNDGDVSDESDYDSGDLIKYYGGFEPRFMMNYLIDNTSSLKFSYARNMQYLHMLSNTTSTTPLDIWQPSTNNVEPGISDQIALGYFRNFDDNNYEASAEIYYKDLQNQIEYKNGADLLLNENVEAELVYGKGWSYGFELYLKKNYGDFSGWIGYTWAKTERLFDDINDGDPFPYKYDRTHDFSIVTMYKASPKWDFGAVWVYNSGNAVTFPSGKYEIDGKTINLYTERNGYRMPAYHRLDLSITYNFKNRSSLNFTLYNAYGQKNAYSINFREKEGNPLETEAVMTYLFTYFPSLTYNFKF